MVKFKYKTNIDSALHITTDKRLTSFDQIATSTFFIYKMLAEMPLEAKK